MAGILEVPATVISRRHGEVWSEGPEGLERRTEPRRPVGMTGQQGHMVDVLVSRGDEGRWNLR
jgi:hypothetical protein